MGCHEGYHLHATLFTRLDEAADLRFSVAVGVNHLQTSRERYQGTGAKILNAGGQRGKAVGFLHDEAESYAHCDSRLSEEIVSRSRITVRGSGVKPSSALASRTANPAYHSS